MCARTLRLLAASYIGFSALFAGEASAQNVCKDVARGIDQLVLEAADGKVLVRLAPYLGIEAAKQLLSRAGSAPDEAAFFAYLAVGLSRHSEALRLLHEGTRPRTDGQRLSRALALLALGDGAATGTVSAVLFGGALEDRRRVAEALARMPQKRPRQMLYEAIDDVDEIVRYHAAKVFVEVDSVRAKKALAEMLKGSALQKKAAHVLVRNNYFFKPDELAQVSAPDRAQMIIVDAARGRRSNLRLLGQQFRANDEVVRSSAFAAMALLQGAEVAQMKKLERLLEKKPTMDVGAELVTGLALTNDATSLKGLEGFDKTSAKRSLAVLWAFASAGPPRSQLDPTHAGQIARAIESWMTAGFLEDEEAARAIRAMERCDPLAGLLLARSRLQKGEGGTALRTAIRLLGRSGSVNDVPALIDIAKKAPADLKSEALRAAARVCAR
jgi:hypothetical protein